MKIFHKTCKENGIMHNNQKIFDYLHKFEEKEQTKQIKLI